MAATMVGTLAGKLPSRARRLPRWWRRLLVVLRRANVFLLIETIAAIALVMMVTLSAYDLDPQSTPGNILLPAKLTSTLLIGTLVPALTLIVLFGRGGIMGLLERRRHD